MIRNTFLGTSVVPMVNAWCTLHKYSVRSLSRADDRSPVSKLCNRSWLLSASESKPSVSTVEVAPGVHLRLVRDDLLHPYLGGNKLRKLDALFLDILSTGATHVVTCGGVQSAHTAAVAAVCAEHGVTSHLLVRGERPAIVSGYHLLARMFSDVIYVPRQEYACRQSMFEKQICQLAAAGVPADQIAVIEEGAANPCALLGFIRLVDQLRHQLPCDGPCDLVVDSGTGTTALGVALGIVLCGLPWRVQGVMLAGTEEYYNTQCAAVLNRFSHQYQELCCPPPFSQLPLHWVPRTTPRKFGKVFESDVIQCRMVAQEHGVLLDPIYSLSGWQVAAATALSHSAGGSSPGVQVVYLHSGGALGLFSLATRHPDWF